MAVRRLIPKLTAAQTIIEPIPVAARAGAPSCPTIATSAIFITTRLRLLVIIGSASSFTFLDISTFRGRKKICIVFNTIIFIYKLVAIASYTTKTFRNTKI